MSVNTDADDLDSHMEDLRIAEHPPTMPNQRGVSAIPIKGAKKNLHITVENFQQLIAPNRAMVLEPDAPAIGSPLSLKSCALCGIDPAELYPVPLESFQKTNFQRTFHNALGDRVVLKPTSTEQKILAKRRFEEFEKERMEKIERVRKQRDILVAEGNDSQETAPEETRARLDSSLIEQNEDFLHRMGTPRSAYFPFQRALRSEFLTRKYAAEERRRLAAERAHEMKENSEIAAIKAQIANDYRRNRSIHEQRMERQRQLEEEAHKRALLRDGVDHKLRQQLYKQKSLQRECDKSNTIYHSPLLGHHLREADRKDARNKALQSIQVNDAKLSYLTPERRNAKAESTLSETM
ncbi:hypothetical protein XU18_4303 [Perkinsela sp. CCAP 1560/4]|nr:hypothetical protein XU18_4303 [Perkinsela sp. CCAP 1560/4]|eukprot:KNH04444.1 hypothetical protein XU18_4303 [Perkinsela sp. CCAP 1560/4]